MWIGASCRLPPRQGRLDVGAPEHEQGYEVVHVAEPVAHPDRHLDLVVGGDSTRPLPIPRPTAARTSSRLRLTFFSTLTTSGILQCAASCSHASSSGPRPPPGAGPEHRAQVLLELPGPEEAGTGPPLEPLQPLPLGAREVLGVLVLMFTEKWSFCSVRLDKTHPARGSRSWSPRGAACRRCRLPDCRP